MSDSDRRPQTVHKHYHLWPDSDCGCFCCAGLIALFFLIYHLAVIKALPWQ